MSASSVRHQLRCLSNLYKRARAEHVVPSGFDPVGDFGFGTPTAGSAPDRRPGGAGEHLHGRAREGAWR